MYHLAVKIFHQAYLLAFSPKCLEPMMQEEPSEL